MAYAVGHHLPGCLPDNEPDIVEDFEDAKQVLVESIELFYDDTDLFVAGEEFRRYLDMTLLGISAALEPFTLQVDGTCWFVQVAE